MKRGIKTRFYSPWGGAPACAGQLRGRAAFLELESVNQVTSLWPFHVQARGLLRLLVAEETLEEVK